MTTSTSAHETTRSSFLHVVVRVGATTLALGALALGMLALGALAPAGILGSGVASAAPGLGVTARGGSTQNTTLGTDFPERLVVTVSGLATGAACPDYVTFSSPTSGASAVFSGTGTHVDSPAAISPSADFTGVCTYLSSTLVADDTVGPFSVSVSVAGGGGAASFTLTNDGIEASGGTHQTAQIGSAFTTPLQVTVYADGAPAKGATVTFVAPGAGASGIFATTATTSATATTNARGVATAPAFAADDTQGTYLLSATTSAVPGTASFTLTNSAAGLAASIGASSGMRQSTDVGTTYADPLEVTVTDADGNPVQGVEVTFSAAQNASTGASGSFVGAGQSATVATDSEGVATSPLVEANGSAGAFTVTATTQGLTAVAEFTLTNLGAASVRVAAGTKQSAVIGTTYARPLEVEVTDAQGKPLQGAEVTFTLPTGQGTSDSATSGSAAGGTFPGTAQSATVLTDAAGLAVSPRVRANEVAGAFTVTATTQGLAATTAFTLTNRGPSAVATFSGSRQTAVVGTTYARPLRVKVTAGGKAVAGAEVTFTVGTATSGATGSFANAGQSVTATTNSAGLAVSPLVQASEVSGTFTVTVTTPGLDAGAHFILENLPGAPASVTPGAGVTQTAPAGHVFGIPFSVTVTDAEKNPVAGVKVTFRAPRHGPSGTFATTQTTTVTVKTDAEGIAVAPAFRANGVRGGYIVTAAVEGLSPPVAFALVDEAPTTSRTAGHTHERRRGG